MKTQHKRLNLEEFQLLYDNLMGALNNRDYDKALELHNRVYEDLFEGYSAMLRDRKLSTSNEEIQRLDSQILRAGKQLDLYVEQGLNIVEAKHNQIKTQEEKFEK